MEPTGRCETCHDTGWYGDDGPGLWGNREVVRCDCGRARKCAEPHHKYDLVAGIPWCCTCDLEADTTICRLHPLPRDVA
jgi:hypothetical protein